MHDSLTSALASHATTLMRRKRCFVAMPLACAVMYVLTYNNEHLHVGASLAAAGGIPRADDRRLFDGSVIMLHVRTFTAIVIAVHLLLLYI